MDVFLHQTMIDGTLVYTVIDLQDSEQALAYARDHPVIVDHDDENYVVYEVEAVSEVKASYGEAVSFGRDNAKMMGPSLLIPFMSPEGRRWLQISRAEKVVSY